MKKELGYSFVFLLKIDIFMTKITALQTKRAHLIQPASHSELQIILAKLLFKNKHILSAFKNIQFHKFISQKYIKK